MRAKWKCKDLRIPDGHFDAAVIDLHGLDLEVDADCGLHGLEDVIREAEEDAGLAHAAIADQQDLECLVEFHTEAVREGEGC